MRKRNFGIAGVALLAACHGAPPPTPNTVGHVDMNRYAGKWYEIARIPVWFEDGWMGVTAEFITNGKGDEGSVKVTRVKKDGKIRSMEASTYVVDPPANTRLNVTFFWPFSWQYWIFRLDRDYRYVAIGSPDRATLWILCRKPQMDDETYLSLTEPLRSDGFNVDKLEKTPPAKSP